MIDDWLVDLLKRRIDLQEGGLTEGCNNYRS
jgi:hypothetical protein